MNVEVYANITPIMNETPFEVVERKGLGHPDTICDLITEKISTDLADYYLNKCGNVLHYNIDKALLVAGRSEPSFHGGKIIEPCKLYLGDRAINSFNGKSLHLDEVISGSIDSWLKENLRFLRMGENFEWNSQIKQGSATLNSVERRLVANDTSVGVGYWPLSSTENLVLEIEGLLNSKKYKQDYPEIGEDIKVMAIRREKKIDIILACAFVDKYVSNLSDYVSKKNLVLGKLKDDLRKNEFFDTFDMSFGLNALDDLSQENAGIY